MTNSRIFTGLLLLGLGLLFLLEQTNIVILNEWPIVLIITGVALLGQAYIGKDNSAILPGVILFGFGVHFIVVNKLNVWPDHHEVFLLILATAFLLRYQKVRDGLFTGIFLLIVAIILLFFEQITGLFPTLNNTFTFIWKFWPITFILVGCYVLFVRR